MLDTKLLRENFDEVKKSLANRGFDLDKNHFDEIDKQRKSLQIEVENLQSERKKLSSEYGERKKSGQDTEEIKSKVDSINTTLKDKEDELNNYLEKLNDFLMGIPKEDLFTTYPVANTLQEAKAIRKLLNNVIPSNQKKIILVTRYHIKPIIFKFTPKKFQKTIDMDDVILRLIF